MKMKGKPQAKQYVIYSRKSKFTGKGESIENQIELCRQYIAMHFGEDAAEKALSNEDEREEHLKCERMPRRVEEAEQRVGVRTPRSADKDTQFSE